MINEISPVPLLNIYSVGSQHYGTNTENSDIDYKCIGILPKSKRSLIVIKDNIDIHIYSQKEFEKQLRRGNIEFIEALFHPVSENVKIEWKLDKPKLVNFITRLSRNNWDRMIRKIINEEERDILLAKKSLFHAFRIINFGEQLINFGEIKDWKGLVPLFNEIMTTSFYEREGLWDELVEDLKNRYYSKLFDSIDSFENI